MELWGCDICGGERWVSLLAVVVGGEWVMLWEVRRAGWRGGEERGRSAVALPIPLAAAARVVDAITGSFSSGADI